MTKLKALMSSRRFILLLAGLIVAFAHDQFNVEISEEQANVVAMLVASWILGDSLRETKEETKEE